MRRAKGVNFIYQAGVMLDLPQITLWVAGVFFHRFYMRCQMLPEKGGIHHYVSCFNSRALSATDIMTMCPSIFMQLTVTRH